MEQHELDRHILDGTSWRDTITGTLKASIVSKTRGNNIGNLIAGSMARDLLHSGKMRPDMYRKFFYAPSYYMSVDGLKQRWRIDRPGKAVQLGGPSRRDFIFSFAGRPKAFDPIAHHKATVTVTGTFEPWRNGLGARILRPKVIEIVPVEREDDPRSGS
jgi:hypothetical protein